MDEGIVAENGKTRCYNCSQHQFRSARFPHRKRRKLCENGRTSKFRFSCADHSERSINIYGRKIASVGAYNHRSWAKRRENISRGDFSTSKYWSFHEDLEHLQRIVKQRCSFTRIYTHGFNGQIAIAFLFSILRGLEMTCYVVIAAYIYAALGTF